MQWTDADLPVADARCRYCRHQGDFPHWKSFTFENRRFSLYRCPSCASLIYVPLEILAAAQTIDLAEIARVQAGHIEIGDKYYLEVGYSTDHIALCVLAALAGVPRAEQQRHAFVDIGAGFGLSSYLAHRQFGMDTITVEPSLTGYLGSQLLGLDVYPAYIEDLPASVLERLASKPTLLHLNSVIEHLREPAEVIRALIARTHIEAIAAIVPDGGAIDPNSSFAAMLPYLAPGDHLHLPTEAGMRQFFEGLGFPIFAMRRVGLLLVAVGARQPMTFPDNSEVESTRNRFLRDLTEHPNPMLAGGAAGRLLPHAVLARDEEMLIRLRQLYAERGTPQSFIARLQQGAGWNEIPFNLGPTAFWLAVDAYSTGRSAEGHAWCDLIEVCADRLVTDYPIYASQTLHLRNESRLHRAHNLAAAGEWNAALHWVDALIGSAGDRTLGASTDQIERAQALRVALVAAPGKLGWLCRLRRVVLARWRERSLRRQRNS